MSGYTCNPRYNTPSPDVLRKLELSRLEAEKRSFKPCLFQENTELSGEQDAVGGIMKLRNVLVYGNRRYDPNKNIPEGAERLFRYYRLIQECMAA